MSVSKSMAVRAPRVVVPGVGWMRFMVAWLLDHACIMAGRFIPIRVKFFSTAVWLASSWNTGAGSGAGTVAFAGEQGSYGNLFVVNHQRGRQPLRPLAQCCRAYRSDGQTEIWEGGFPTRSEPICISKCAIAHRWVGLPKSKPLPSAKRQEAGNTLREQERLKEKTFTNLPPPHV